MPGPTAPGRRLPLLYLGLAHLCLAAAFAAVALVPAAVAGFYYHPRALAVVHLVTLGWITASILGALYMIVPMALAARGRSLDGRVAGAMGPDARRHAAGDAVPSSRRGNAADGPMPPATRRATRGFGPPAALLVVDDVPASTPPRALHANRKPLSRDHPDFYHGLLDGRLPAGRADVWVFALYAIGATGIASHFWLVEPVGMAWSAALAAAAALWVTGRAARAVRAARIPREVEAHFQLAFFNLLLAASLGVAVAFDKLSDLLPGSSLDHVLAHAHLAALGWATMIVMAAGYRLLPMILPAAPPTGPWVWVGAAVLEVGVLGLSLSLYAGSGPVAAWAALCAAGIAVFVSRVAWMLRHRRPPPQTLRLPEIGRFHIAAAFVWLAIATALGLAIAFAPAAAWRQRAILVYGAAGLVGFLSQIVVGVAARIVPLWIWLAEIGGRDHPERPPSPYSLADRRLQIAILALWTAGVPLLAAGLALDAWTPIRLGAALLALAVLGGSWQLTIIWRTARRAL